MLDGSAFAQIQCLLLHLLFQILNAIILALEKMELKENVGEITE